MCGEEYPRLYFTLEYFSPCITSISSLTRLLFVLGCRPDFRFSVALARDKPRSDGEHFGRDSNRGCYVDFHLTHGSAPVVSEASRARCGRCVAQSRRAPLDGGTRAPFRSWATWIRRRVRAESGRGGRRRGLRVAASCTGEWPSSSALPGRAPGAERPWPTTAFGHSRARRRRRLPEGLSLATVAPRSGRKFAGDYTVAWPRTGVCNFHALLTVSGAVP